MESDITITETQVYVTTGGIQTHYACNDNYESAEQVAKLHKQLSVLTAERDELQAVVDTIPEMADGTRVTGDLIGHDVWTWAFPGMFMSSFRVKYIRTDGEGWELVGEDSRYVGETFTMYAGLCCLSEEAAVVAEAAAKAASDSE